METTGCWSQLGLVMWRQVWLTRVRRHYLVTLLELTCMVFMLSSVWEESVAPYRARPNKDQFFDSADATEFWGRPNESWNEGTLAFAPDQAFFADLTARVCKELGSKWRLLLPLQYFVESAYIQMIAESLQKPINVKVELMRFPYPRLFYGSEDHTLSLVSLRFAISFFVPFCLLVVKLVKEKRVGAKMRPNTRSASQWSNDDDLYR